MFITMPVTGSGSPRTVTSPLGANSIPAVPCSQGAIWTVTGAKGYSILKNGYEYNIALIAMGIGALLAFYIEPVIISSFPELMEVVYSAEPVAAVPARIFPPISCLSALPRSSLSP